MRLNRYEINVIILTLLLVERNGSIYHGLSLKNTSTITSKYSVIQKKFFGNISTFGYIMDAYAYFFSKIPSRLHSGRAGDPATAEKQQQRQRIQRQRQVEHGERPRG